jgi:hypothetical protein
MNQQLDLIPEPSPCQQITVSGYEFPATVQRLRDLGAVILSFGSKGSTYTLNVILPDGLTLERAMEDTGSNMSIE